MPVYVCVAAPHQYGLAGVLCIMQPVADGAETDSAASSDDSAGTVRACVPVCVPVCVCVSRVVSGCACLAVPHRC